MLIPDHGDCFIDSYSIRENSVKALKNLGIVFQSSTIDMELTILENLFFHARLHGIKIKKIKSDILEELLANNLIKKAENKVKTLSGGERRKVELIRALIHNPKLLIMDEPTVGLDPNSRKDLLVKILELKKNKKLSVLWATHLVDEADKADKIVILEHGKVLISGKPKEIMKKTSSRSLSEVYFKLTEAKK
tara:strand:- start:25 stop:600 length:576 start_codon:yes stop_codon:yes gene_type:complete